MSESKTIMMHIVQQL